MGFPLWTLLVLVFSLPSSSYRIPLLDSNCLYRRSRCLHDTACRLRIEEFDSICGESPTECLASSPSDCVHLLWQIKHWLGDDQCECHPLFGATRECNRFGHLLYDHPCERLLRREPFNESPRSIGVTRDYGRRRTTRSPSSVQINEWKKQLSGDLYSLPTTTQLQSQECDVALHEICLRHVSCSQLWNLFRKNCDVDSDNTCIMPQREACWESFEGLLWTGLGRCHCSSNVSDCHWIRLHTNFNKCIYEISRSSGISLSSFIPLSQSLPPPPTQRVSFVNFASQSISTPPPTPPTVPPSTVFPTHSRMESTTAPSPIPTITVPRPREIPATPPPRTEYAQRSEDRSATGIHVSQGQIPPSSQPIDNRVAHPDYRIPVQPTHDQRIDSRSQIRINEQTIDGYSSSPSSQSVQQRAIDRMPAHSNNQMDYRTQTTVQPRHDYRTHEEGRRVAHPTQSNQHNQRRTENQDYGTPSNDPYRTPTHDPYRNPANDPHRNPTSDPYRAPPRDPYHHPTRDPYPDWSTPNPRTTTPLPTYPTLWYGRGEDEIGRSPVNGWDRIEENGGTRTTSRREEEERLSGIRKEGNRVNGRQDNRLGQITQSNGGRTSEATRKEEKGRKENKQESTVESPHRVSSSTNEERSRDEYEVSTPGVVPSHSNPTIITSQTNRDMEEERRRRKDEEERRRRKEEEERREREKKREREREERRKMEEKRKKEEDDQRERERIEKIRMDEEKKEEEKRRKEKEREEKKREKERQEKITASRNKEISESVSSSSPSCLSSLRECESIEVCKFQLAELKTRCPKNCDRKQCQGALRRFSSFVPPALSMALSFCSCPNGEENCAEKELLYPPCIYERADLPPCETIDQDCRREHKCKQLVSSMAEECPIVKGACDGGTKCTQLLLKARGSTIDTQCHCAPKDKQCLSLQSTMIPNHPCLAESRREFYRLETQETSISLKPTKNENSMDGQKKQSVVAPSRLTTTTEPQSIGDEVESAPWLTTITVPTTTTEYTTHAPPPAEGCSMKDSKGRPLFFHVGSILRRNLDWSGRCSSWCECVSEEVLKCRGLPCSPDLNCSSHAPQFTHQYGERLYLKDRGPCMCESGDYTCAQPPETSYPELYPGIYLMLGYSQSDIDMLEKEMPSDFYQRAGFLSNKRATDIASQLQIVLESLLPPTTQCRLSVVEDFDSPGNALLRVEWHGMVPRLNQTKVSWQWGQAEKACSTYIRKLEDIFDLDESPRFQLVLSTVKQMKVTDLLDIIPDCSPFPRSLAFPLITVFMTLRYLF